MLKSLQGLVVSGDHWNRTAVCYDDGDIKVYVTYSDLLQSSSELTSNLRKCVGVKKVCFVPEAGLVFLGSRDYYN